MNPPFTLRLRGRAALRANGGERPFVLSPFDTLRIGPVEA
jgi:hypothetical protein